MRYYLLTMLLSITLSVFAAEKLVVEQTSGETSWTISAITDITFDGKGVKINFNDGSSQYYAKETFKMLKFEASPSSAIDNIEMSGAVKVEDNIIKTDCEDSEIKVFSVSGTLVAQGCGSLDISHLTEGAYIVQAGNIITKIVRR